MTAPHADPQTVQTIRELAAHPDRVRLTMRAKSDLWAEHLTKEDVCDAICDWIDAGKPLGVITTEHVAEHKGEPAYEMLPRVGDAELYVKVTIVDLGEWQEKLLIISSHRPNR
jgi:hypothetical protein